MRSTMLIAGALLAGALAFGMLASGQSTAQTTKIEIAPEQRTMIRQYVVKEKVKPVKIKSQVKVGAALPATVKLRPAPKGWGPQLTRYHYAYVGDQVVLVEPDTRDVVYVID